ncbi:hypothetical protein K6V98_08360 [Collinsella sp. AGMB00827]|uniref:Prophage tail endopeptidase domain-containing protein n=1 Tax=Collinsella ureilytica TaxID=2869515 RepID=A0ABS7MLV8_9ACTN|nr:hypothetical protein [Collinsella urealyticum]MBY4798357.1 hypothetical protein [Collinsella urealyticum]
MRYISDKFRKRLSENTTLLAKATLYLDGGKRRELTGDDIVSLSVEHNTSSANSFDIGAAITGKLNITLNNHDQRFDEVNFAGSSIVAYAGAEIDGKPEWICLGTYDVDAPDAYAGTIAITALDCISRLEIPYSDVKTVYPARLYQIVSDACLAAGVTLASSFPMSDLRVNKRPEGKDLTCKKIVSYAAQAVGCFVRVNEMGKIELKRYDASVFGNEDWLDGSHFDSATPYASGSSADGGTFNDYSSGIKADGGKLRGSDSWEHIFVQKSLTVSTDDITVTGISVKASKEIKADGKTGKDGEEILYGQAGYVLRIEKNPLIEYGQAGVFALHLGKHFHGMTFRPFKATSISNPALEAGDAVVVTDGKQNSYRSFATAVKLTLNSSMQVSCSAQTAHRNRSRESGAITRAIVEAENEIKRERLAREIELEQLRRELAESSGLFTTKVPQKDGSVISYMHDKRNLADSRIVWKMTASAIGVSTDGGRTYSTALNAEGVAILNRIYAIGLDATYITTGKIQDRRGKNYWDMETGQFSLSSDSRVGGRTVSEIAATAVNSQTQSDILNKLTNNGRSQGIYLTNGQLYINGEYIKANTVSTNKLESYRNSKIGATVGTTIHGNPGMSLSNQYGNYLDIEALRALDDPNNKTTGVGFAVFDEPFMSTSTYYDQVWLWRPDAAYKDTYLEQTPEQLYLSKTHVKLQAAQSKGIFMNGDSVTIKFNDSNFIKIDNSGVAFRCGDSGFGWIDGHFSDSITWS